LFNKKENWNYVGRYPETHFYCPDSMKKEQYASFKKWYEQQNGKVIFLIIINIIIIFNKINYILDLQL